MAAYVISEVEKIEEEAWNNYRQLASEAIAQYGGKYLVRGAAQNVVEGSPCDSLIVILEFPNMAMLKAWYSSKEYSKALLFRDRALRRKLTFVEGISSKNS